MILLPRNMCRVFDKCRLIFLNSFTVKVSREFQIKSSFMIPPPHLKRVYYTVLLYILTPTGLLPSVLLAFSALTLCWLGGRNGIRPVKILERWGVGVVMCLEQGADLHTVQLMPLPLTVSCFSKIQIGFTFLVSSQSRLVLEKGPLNGCVRGRLFLGFAVTMPYCDRAAVDHLWSELHVCDPS